MNEKELAKKIAYEAEKAGGRAYYVGGFVRDRQLRALRPEAEACMTAAEEDTDIEIHGVDKETLIGILEKFGNVRRFGASFGIYSVDGFNIDIALPRTERATGTGHRDFEVTEAPFIGTEAAARRRDFTVNALMEDVLTGEITDHFGGLRDLKDGILRCVDEKTFPEDPLRVLRAAQFAARFGFRTERETLELMRGIDISGLSKERIEGELKKALLKAEKPSVFFEVLREADKLGVWFKELEDLIGVEQDPVFHPEGDVWTHTMQVLDRAACFRENVENAYAFMMLALTHDMGKTVTTEFVNGRIHAYRHEIRGTEIALRFMGRFTSDTRVIRYVKNMLPLHMRPNMTAHARSAVKATNRMFDEAEAPEDLIYFAASDKPVMAGDEPFTGDSGFLRERLSVYREIMKKPHVTGKDLEEAGLVPGEYFGEVLSYAHKLRLAGEERGPALKQAVAYAKKLQKRTKDRQ